MEATTILRAELQRAHEMAGFAMAGLTSEQLHHVGDGSTILSIATVYAHMVHSEDVLMNAFARNQPMLMERENWAEKIGYAFDQDMQKLAELVKGADMDALNEYAQAVYAESDAYIASLSASDLDRVITFGSRGEFPLGIYLGSIIAWHAAHHTGEICALKGCLGGQGLPF